MIKRWQNITRLKWPAIFLMLVLMGWQSLSGFGIVPQLVLPSPLQVARALFSEFGVLMAHARITLWEAFLGLSLGLFLSFALAVVMERWEPVYQGLYPILVITQTIPVIAIAPLLVLWMGYGMAPKVTLVVLVCFFPVVIGLLDGFKTADRDAINLLHAMGANRWQIMRHIKMPVAMPSFFAGLKIAVAYSFVGAVIAEWLGGNAGLGVYMTRVKKAYAFDKMFAVILLIILISLLLMGLTKQIERRVMRYRNIK